MDPESRQVLGILLSNPIMLQAFSAYADVTNGLSVQYLNQDLTRYIIHGVKEDEDGTLFYSTLYVIEERHQSKKTNEIWFSYNYRIEDHVEQQT